MQYVVDHVLKNRFALLLVIVTGFFNNVVTFLLPISIGEFFTLFFNTGSAKGKLLDWMGINLSSVNQFFIFFSGLLILKGVLTLSEKFGTFRQGELFAKEIREKVFSSQMNWSAEAFPDRSYGKYLLRYSNDLKSVQNYLTMGYLEAIKSTLFLLCGIFVIFKINNELGLIIITALCSIMALIYVFGRWQTKFIVISRSSRSSLLAFVSRQFARFKRIKERNREEEMISQFGAKSKTLYEENMKYNLSESILLTIVPVLIFMVIGLLLWRMLYMVQTISAGEGLMLVLILMMMEGGIQRLLKVPTYLNKGKISLQKINKLNIEPPPVIAKELNAII